MATELESPKQRHMYDKVDAPAVSHAYRADVDGLRAVAVLAVLMFHGFPGAARGGFAGVDVFFVISGFLISGIILEGLSSDRFSFADFYWRRMRRIFPALIVVLSACLALGWLALLPDEFAALGKHVAAGAAFVSNLALWREAGYFDTAAELKPLLHLWSLGVEEQYYIGWPLLLFLFRNRPRAMLAMMVGISAVSFAANLWLTPEHPSAAFYLPVTRFWELGAGSLLAYFARYTGLPNSLSNAKATVGVVLLALGFVLLDSDRGFPGWWALLPVLGTVLLVSAGPLAWINRAILAHPALVFVGLISYPLYLWHWPLLTYARIVDEGEPAVVVRVALLAASGVLAWLTYELVEKRIRGAKGRLVPRIAVPGLAAAMTALAGVGVLVMTSRLEPRSASVPLVSEISRATADWEDSGDEQLVGDSSHAVLFFGDSHMQHYWPRIHKIMSEHTGPVRTVLFKTIGGCAPVPGVERRGLRCSAFVDEGLRVAREPQVDTVVIAASWVGFVNRDDYYKVGDPEARPLKLLTPQTEWVLDGLESALRDITMRGKRVVIVLSSPRGPTLDPKSMIDRSGITVQVRHAPPPLLRRDLVALTGPIDERLKRIAAAIGAEVIDPTDWLCGAVDCPAADELGRPLYKDATHLRASVARQRFDAVDRFVYLQ